MEPQLFLQCFHPEAAQHKPQLERPETPAQRHAPVAIIVYLSLVGRAEVFRHDLQCPQKRIFIFYKIGRAVEVGEQPLVRIENKAVGLPDPFDHPAVFRQDQGGARKRGIDMQPDVVSGTECGDLFQRIDGRGPRGAQGSYHANRFVTHFQIRFNTLLQQSRVHS